MPLTIALGRGVPDTLSEVCIPFADQTAWKHVASDLVRDHRVVVYDMMGAGTTNADNFSFSRYSR